MNLPNKLTILRLIFIPFYIFFLMTDFFSFTTHIALFLFILASLTDLADGKIARKRNLITDFGKFADPLADKILVLSGMVCCVALSKLPFWVCIIILARDFAVDGLRLIMSSSGKVIAASYWGKFKTAFQMIMICFMMFSGTATQPPVQGFQVPKQCRKIAEPRPGVPSSLKLMFRQY